MYDFEDEFENHWEQHDDFEGFPRDTQVLACEVPVTVNGKSLTVDVEWECEVSWYRVRDGIAIAVERWDECWCSICDEEVSKITNITDDNGDYYTPSPEEMELIKKSIPPLTDKQKMEACEVIDM